MKFPKPVKRIKARKPLRRSRMSHKRPRRLDRPGSDPKRLRAIRLLPCVGYGAQVDHLCRGRVEVSHLRDLTGASRKEPDAYTIPKCRGLHREWEEYRGFFRGWSRDQRKAWFNRMLLQTNDLLRYFDEEG